MDYLPNLKFIVKVGLTLAAVMFVGGLAATMLPVDVRKYMGLQTS